MSAPAGQPRTHRGSGIRHTCAVAAALVALLSLVGTLAIGTVPASAYWSSSGSAAAAAATSTLSPPVGVTVPEAATADVPVSWTRGENGVQPEGYYVVRDDGGTTAPACGSSPTSLLTGNDCLDEAVSVGGYTYVVTAVYATWTARSAPSTTVTVTAPVLLGAAQSYSVLAATAVVNVGTTTVSGDLGVSPGTTISGIGPMGVGGDIHAGDQHAAAAQADLAVAYADLSTRPPDTELVGDLGGRTLTPGVYHTTAAMALTGTLVLDAQGDPDAVFVFQSSAAFNAAAASAVELTGGAQASNVYWVVAGAAGTGAISFLSGTILAQGAITLGAGAELIGRALSLDAVTLASNTIRFTDAPPPTVGIDGGPAAVTKDTTPAITGVSSAAQGSTVGVTVDGQSLSTTVGADGTWAVTIAELSAGRYEIVARVRDAHGNGVAAVQDLTVEVNPPPVDLGAAATYSVLAATRVTNVGFTTMSGDLGVSPATSVIGFPPGTFGGALHAGDPAAATAQQRLLAALDEASSRAPHTEIAGDLGGKVFHAGVHHQSAALALTGTVTLDGEGDPGAVFIFLGDAALDTAAASNVSLTNGAQPHNVFWVVAGAIGTGASSSMSGALLARGAITLGAGSALTGQALSRNAVTLAGNTLTGVTPAPQARVAPSETPPVESAAPEAPPVLPEAPTVPEPAEPTAQPDVSETPDETAPSNEVLEPEGADGSAPSDGDDDATPPEEDPATGKDVPSEEQVEPPGQGPVARDPADEVIHDEATVTP